MSDSDIEELMKQTEIHKPWEQNDPERSLEDIRETSELFLAAFDETGDPQGSHPHLP